jgi:hypothetical protein
MTLGPEAAAVTLSDLPLGEESGASQREPNGKKSTVSFQLCVCQYPIVQFRWRLTFER